MQDRRGEIFSFWHQSRFNKFQFMRKSEGEKTGPSFVNPPNASYKRQLWMLWTKNDAAPTCTVAFWGNPARTMAGPSGNPEGFVPSDPGYLPSFAVLATRTKTEEIQGPRSSGHPAT